MRTQRDYIMAIKKAWISDEKKETKDAWTNVIVENHVRFAKIADTLIRIGSYLGWKEMQS